MVAAGFSLCLLAQVKTCGYQDSYSLKEKPRELSPILLVLAGAFD